MPKVNCAVVGCTNSTYRLNKWKKEVCNQHKAEKNVHYVKNHFYYINFQQQSRKIKKDRYGLKL